MTRIDRPQPGIGQITTAFNAAQAQELKAKDERVAAKGPAELQAMDPQKAAFLQEIFGQQVGTPGAEAAVFGEAHLLQAQNSDASALFAPLAQQLAEPQPGQVLGKAFAREAGEKPAPTELGQLSSMQLIAGSVLLANPMTAKGLSQKAQLLSHFSQFFGKALSSPNSSKTGTAAQGRPANSAQAKSKTGGLSSVMRSFLSDASPAEDPEAVTPYDKEIVAAIDGERREQTAAQAEGHTAATGNAELESALDEAVNRLGATLDKSEMPAGMDIDQMVEWVFMELGKDVEADVRGLLEEMQQNYKKKAATTQLMQQYKDAQVAMERKMRDEYQALQAMTPPRIGKGVPFEEYKAWRQVSWPTPKPDPVSGEFPPLDFQTCQPWPPIMPTYLTRDRGDSASGVKGPDSTKREGGNPEDPEVKYGLPSELDNTLKQIFNALPKDTKDGMTYDEWLQQVVGLERVDNLDDVKLNADQVKEYLDDLPTSMSEHSQGVDKAKKSAETMLVQQVQAIETYLQALFPTGNPTSDQWKTFWDTNGAVLNGTISTMLNDVIAKLGDGGLALPNGSKVADAINSLLAKFQGKAPLGVNGGNVQMLANQAKNLATAYKDTPNKKVLGQNITLADVTTKSGVDVLALRELALKQCSYDTVGVGPTDMAERAMDGIKDMLANNTPPLDETQRKAFEDIVSRYKDDLGNSSEIFLDELKDLLIGEDYREGGKHYAVTLAIIGQSEAPAAAPSTGAAAAADVGIAATGNLGVNDKINDQKNGGVKTPLPNKPTKTPIKHDRPIKIVKPDIGVYKPGIDNLAATGNQTTGDAGWDKPEETGDRLRNWLLGDNSAVDLSDWEKNAIKQGIIDDPALVAEQRRAEIEQQKRIEAEEKAAAEAAAIGQGAQNAAAGHSNVGGLENLKLEVDKLQSQIDGMGDFGQMQSMRLQIFMDRRSKFFETLSNIMKKRSTVIETIIGNVKS